MGEKHNMVPRRRPKKGEEGLPWTLSLWLTFQQERQDAVGLLARMAEKDRGWPGWRDRDGLEEYLREQGAGEETLRGLQVAYAEWEEWMVAKEGGG